MAGRSTVKTPSDNIPATLIEPSHYAENSVLRSTKSGRSPKDGSKTAAR